MKISIELTLTPLQNDFEAPIKNFIKKLRASEFTVLENPLSTQIYGDYNKVVPFVTTEIENSFKNLNHVVLTMKMVKSDRSNYEPNF